jgi:asparagine synthase (glutamine-hydrolysing)
MCGIVGFLAFDSSHEELTARISHMAKSLVHRGPDDEGVWISESDQVALGHRRLAIVDLSPLGHQPMVSSSGRYVIVLNGEIYNFRDLKNQIGGSYRGGSDTEVLLAAIEKWGIEQALQKCVGMFAFALWDTLSKTLVIARDRLGEKPLYYGTVGRHFVFASELKAIEAHPAWQSEIDRDSLVDYMRFGYVPTPRSIFKNVSKLEPGTFCQIHASSRRQNTVNYWSAIDVATDGIAKRGRISESEHEHMLEEQLKMTVRDQMVADVSVGAFLSGGIDSSLVVALMQSLSERPVKTFSIGFKEFDFDESEHAKKVARHLKTEHTELFVTPDETLKMIERLPFIYDEPFADSSQIPTTILSQLTRKHVTVSLSGDGGDELFGGYPHYFSANRVWETIFWTPKLLRTSIGRAIPWVPRAAWAVIDPIMRLIVGKENIRGKVVDRLSHLAKILSSKDFEALYRQFIYPQEQSAVLHSRRSAELRPLQIPHGSRVDRMMFDDMVHYLCDDILVKVDRASMSASLESRAPFLDHRVVELAWATPLSMKLKNKRGKFVLRKILSRYVPSELFERPKQGFGVPIKYWLRDSLRDWAEDLLGESKLNAEGFLDASLVRQRWNEHVHGSADHSQFLWNVLMFQSWLDRNKGEKKTVR